MTRASRFPPNRHTVACLPKPVGYAVSAPGANSNVTGAGGLIIFAIVPAKPIALQAKPSDIDRLSSPISAIVRAGTTTIVSIFPAQ